MPKLICPSPLITTPFAYTTMEWQSSNINLQTGQFRMKPTLLLYDIGTTEDNLKATKMSFEFYGGILALDILQNSGITIASKKQAESVAKALMRHQDLCEKGKITALGQLLPLATVFDNTGSYADLVHMSTIEDVTSHFPRLHWTDCFVRTMKQEIKLNPSVHTTTLFEKEVPQMVRGISLMSPYE